MNYWGTQMLLLRDRPTNSRMEHEDGGPQATNQVACVSCLVLHFVRQIDSLLS